MPERALQDVYRMFDRLGIYEELLEKPLLKHTEMFYQEEASNAVASMQLPEYLSLVTKRLTDERRRSTHYVPPSTFAVLEGVVYRVMVTAHLDFLLGPELSAALDKEDTPTLARVLSLLQDTDATLRLKEAVEKFVQVRNIERQKGGGDREGDRGGERETERDGERQTEAERDRQREGGERQTDRQRDRQRERERDRERQMQVLVATDSPSRFHERARAKVR